MNETSQKVTKMSPSLFARSSSSRARLWRPSHGTIEGEGERKHWQRLTLLGFLFHTLSDMPVESSWLIFTVFIQIEVSVTGMDYNIVRSNILSVTTYIYIAPDLLPLYTVKFNYSTLEALKPVNIIIALPPHCFSPFVPSFSQSRMLFRCNSLIGHYYLCEGSCFLNLRFLSQNVLFMTSFYLSIFINCRSTVFMF